MKFRCKMNDLGSIRLFYRVLGAVSKVAHPTCVIRINPEMISIFTQVNPASDGSFILAEFVPEYMFDEFNMSGYAEEHNEIYIEANPEVVMRGLKVPQNNAKVVRMKLTNRAGPCLCIEAELPSQNIGKCRLTSFDAPISVVHIKSWEDITPRGPLPFTISCCLPAVKTFKTVIDRMRSLTHYGEISLSSEGVLRVQVGGGNDGFVITTEFNETEMLEGPPDDPVTQNEDEAEVSQSKGFYSVTIDIRKLATFLGSNHTPSSYIKCDIKHNQYLQLTTGSPGSYQIRYVIPALDLQGF